MANTTFIDKKTPIYAEWLNTVNASTFTYNHIKDPIYGVIGNGITDDTVAFQAALDASTTKPLIIPKDTTISCSGLTLQSNTRVILEGSIVVRSGTVNLFTGSNLSGISFTGFGSIDCRSSTVSNAFYLDHITDSEFIGLTITSSGNVATTSNQANGIFINIGERITIKGCTFKNNRRSALNLRNVDWSVITENTFLEAVQPLGDTSGILGNDIYLGYSSNNNIISGNTSTSGTSSCVLVQTINDTDESSHNLIIGNNFSGARGYGICVYRKDSTSVLNHTVISSNVIKDIYGDAYNAAVSGFSFGCGIYNQGGEHTTIIGNTIERSHIGSVTFFENLAPGAIGSANSKCVVISGNTIKDASMFGIHFNDTLNYGGSLGGSIVSNNTICNTTRAGIKAEQKGNLSILDNFIDTCGGSGIWIHNSSGQIEDKYVIADNIILNTQGIAGIDVTYATDVHISGGVIDGNPTHGISIGNINGGDIRSITIKNHTNRGISVGTAVDSFAIKEVTIVGTGSSSAGVLLNSQVSCQDITISGCVSTYTGTYANQAPAKIMYGIAAPTTGTYRASDLMMNTSPSAGGYVGWVCTVGGTPGTWKTYGAISA